MIQTWVLISILAAIIQSARTALQKHLTKNLSTLSITYIRSLFSLPCTICVLVILYLNKINLPNFDHIFIFYCALAGIAQIGGTALLLSIFSKRNFAIGITYTKTEAIQTAIFSILFFSETIGLGSFLAISISFIGIVLISLDKEHLKAKSFFKAFFHKTAAKGIASGTIFTFAGLFIREATLKLDSTLLMNASFALFTMLIIQLIVLISWIALRNKKELTSFLPHLKTSFSIGLFSCIASILWFSAFALTKVAFVKTVGQIEIIFSLFLAYKLFKEQITKTEILGIFLILTSILLIINF
jgi:drug/metabolite transporter (DMT)-like permease